MSINRPVMREALCVAGRHASAHRIATLAGFGLGLFLVRGIVRIGNSKPLLGSDERHHVK